MFVYDTVADFSEQSNRRVSSGLFEKQHLIDRLQYMKGKLNYTSHNQSQQNKDYYSFQIFLGFWLA